MTKRLADKIALVTGAASTPGLGSATAQRFAEEGAKVCLTDLDNDGAEKMADAIRQNGGTAFAMAHDVTDEDAWDAVFARITEEFGALDCLVNNAGIAVLRPIENFTTEDWRRQIVVNMDSVFFGTQRAVAVMRESGKGGAIVNISSVAGLVGVPACSAYAAAKAGVCMFSKTIAIECAHDNIRVNSVHPGMIDTNIQNVARTDNAEHFDAVVNSIPMGRMGEPIDIANANLFLCSDEGRYITGTELIIDGGMTAQ